jgi:hypothetical protein
VVGCRLRHRLNPIRLEEGQYAPFVSASADCCTWLGGFRFAFLVEGDGVLNNDEELVATILLLDIGTCTDVGPEKGACTGGSGSGSGGTDPPPKLAIMDYTCCCCCSS